MELQAKELYKTGVFKTETAVQNYIVMKILHEKGEPVGAWQLQEDLLKHGIKSSTASIGRLLRNLDYKGYTTRMSNKGRVLTTNGDAKLRGFEERIRQVRQRDNFQNSLQVNKYEELTDLLLARKAIETEAARQAALKATPEELEKLEKAVRVHKTTVDNNLDPTETALDFHAVVAEISHNKYLKTLLDMLVYEEKKIEAVFASLVTRERGHAYASEHQDIAYMIMNHEPDKAASLMEKHIQTLYDAICEQIDEDF